MPKGRRDRRGRWRAIGLMAVLAVTIIAFLQQPAGSPPARVPTDRDGEPQSASPTGPDGSPIARNDALAQRAAEMVAATYPVKDVEVAVKYDVALIAVVPEPGLSPDDHRRLEEDIAAAMPGKIQGVREVLVTTDPAMHQSIQQLNRTQRNVERRIGTRMTESNVLWARQFDHVASQIQELGSHARHKLPAAASKSGASDSNAADSDPGLDVETGSTAARSVVPSRGEPPQP